MLFKRYRCGQSWLRSFRTLHSGFSLLELLCVLLLIGVLASIGVSSYHNFISSQRLSLYVNQIARAIRFARHQAMVLESDVVLCGSSNAQHCDGNWQHGQIILQGKRVVKHFPQFDSAYHISWRGSLGKIKQLEFNAMGAVAAQGSFYIEHRQQQCRIILNRLARLRVACDERSKIVRHH